LADRKRPAADISRQPSWLRALILPAGLIVLITFGAHSPAIRGGFVWDDDVYVTANPHLQSASGLHDIWLRPTSILKAYPGRGIDVLLPVTFTTLWLEHRLWGTAPLGYHLVNIALHGLAAVLLWRLLLMIGVRGAWLAAAIFAVHPVTVESVAWIAELKNVQSGVLALLCLLAFFRFRPLEEREAGADGHRWRFYLLALLLFGAALLTKSAVVALPVVILLILWWRRGRLLRGDLGAVAPMLGMGLVLGWMTILAEKQAGGAAGAPWQASFVERGLIAGRTLWFYAGKLVWPAGLTSIYPRWDVDATSPWQYVYPLAALAALSALWLLRGRVGRGPLVAALCFAAMLGPVLGFFKVSYHLYSFVADHFQYHAAPALIALFAATVVVVHDRFLRDRFLRGGSAFSGAVGGGVLLLALGSMTFRHAQAFRSEKARCLEILEHNPTAWLAMNNLGVALASEGKFEEAVRQYENALKTRPGYAEAHNNLGVALVALSRYQEAIVHYRAALAIWPAYAAAHNNLGTALASAGRPEDAVQEFQEALRIKPDYAEAHKNLGTTLVSAGRVEDALVHYLEALRVRPGYAEAHNDLGLALAAVGRLDEAIGQYLEALRIEPQNARTHNNLGMALASKGNLREAVDHYREAVRIDPGYGEARNNLGTALASAGKPQEAIAQYQEAVRTSPENAEARNNLGTALASSGNLPEAIAQYREAVRLRPGYAAAHVNLGTALASTGKLEEAVRSFQESVRLEPGSAAAHDSLGVCLARLGRIDQAIPHFEQALRIDPGSESARSHLDRARGLSDRSGARPGGSRP